jgi:hypothetical protein
MCLPLFLQQEEKRLSMSKYAHFATKGFTPLPQSMAAPTSTMGMPPVSAMGMAPNPAMGMAPNNMGMGKYFLNIIFYKYTLKLSCCTLIIKM